MNKVHFKKERGEWVSYRDRDASFWALPVSRGATLEICKKRTYLYLPRSYRKVGGL